MEIANGPKWGKWLIFTIGVIFLIYSIFLVTLSLYGTEIDAKITSYRRAYGERNETIRNQYTFLFGYEFQIEGKTYSGTGQKIGNSVFLKHTDNSYMKVKYLKCCPYLNTDYNGNKTILNGFITLGVGFLLLYFYRKM